MGLFSDHFEKEIDELTKRNEDLTKELMRKSAEASEAQEILKRWRLELELLADQKGHNLCWKDIPTLLKNTIGHTGKWPDPEKVTREEFKLGCDTFVEDVFGKKD